MSHDTLTANAIKLIYAAQLCPNPVLQIIDVRKIVPTPGQQQQSNQDRYRLLVSDGVNYQQGMLGTQQNYLIKENKVQTNTVVRLTEYVCNNTSNNKRIIIILNLDVLAQAPDRIGEPSNIENPMQGQALPPVPQINNHQSNSNSNSNNYQNNQSQNNYQNNNNNSQHAPSSQITYSRPQGASQLGKPISKDNKAQDISHNAITPVDALNPYQNRWTIKVRVTFKGPIKDYTAKSERTRDGKLFHFDVIDEKKGEIRITMFNEIVDVFFNEIHENNVYYISHGNLKAANKRFTNLKHEFELTLDRLSIVQQAIDDGAIGGTDFKFVPISELLHRNKDDNVDVIGIVHNVMEKTSFTTRSDSREIAKMSLTIWSYDGAIDVTLWGKLADEVKRDWVVESKPVLAIKGAKVSDFNTKSLNCSGPALLVWDPTLEEANKLRAWYDSNPANPNLLSARIQGSGQTSYKDVPVYTLQAAKDKITREGDLLYSVRAMVRTIPHGDNNHITYRACVSEKCNKRVTEMGGSFTCASNHVNPTCDERYVLKANVMDRSGSEFLSAFGDQAVTIMNKVPANRLPNKDNNAAAFDAVINDACFKMYNFVIFGKMEEWQETSRPKCTVRSIEPVDFRAESIKLLKAIDELTR